MRRVVPLLALLGLILMAACGGDEEGEQATPTPPLVSPTATPTGAASPTVERTITPPAPMGTLPMTKLAFLRRYFAAPDANYEIYVLTPDGGEVNVTNDPAEDENPDWSPDGTKIAFASNRSGNYDIYVMNADGGNLVRLTDDPAGEFSPRWSPDGTRIAFSRLGSIMVMDSDGSNVTRVTQAQSEATAAPCEAGAFVGSWSPDGKQLTFYAASATRGIGQICTVNVDGTGLTTVVSEPPTYHVEPSWSPDGDWIVYRSILEGNHEIYIVRPDGSSNTNLTNSPATDIEPDWSPDGEWIVFSSDRDGNFELYVMRADGSDLTRLTTDPGKDSDASWSPK